MKYLNFFKPPTYEWYCHGDQKSVIIIKLLPEQIYSHAAGTSEISD